MLNKGFQLFSDQGFLLIGNQVKIYLNVKHFALKINITLRLSKHFHAPIL
jgi:hypothetical protein